MVVTKCFTALIQLLKVRDNYDPGNCGKSNHGELIVVKDRENKDTILVCTEDKAVYTWKTTEGIHRNCISSPKNFVYQILSSMVFYL